MWCGVELRLSAAQAAPTHMERPATLVASALHTHPLNQAETPRSSFLT